jgi:PTH2 family peptidyl-tRNA hydrolase
MKKMIIVMRTDLNMRCGKQIIQGAHCAVNVILQQGEILSHNNEMGIFIPLTADLTEWLNGDTFELFNGKYTKITVGVNSEDEIIDLCRQADFASINYKITTDLGLTEFHGIPTITSCAIGPADVDEIDKITGHLKLL